ncbi:MAG TPA: response regulator [Allosphingosinicella sp.]|jgi:DNA-binding response OmpR family regulator
MADRRNLPSGSRRASIEPVLPEPVVRMLLGKPGTRRRLLLIDDELSVARFIAHAAEECGYEAIITVTAESFRSQYLTCDPDVVVLDLALPRSDGVELLRFLAEEKCRALVLPISGFDGRVLEASMRLGTALGLRMAGPLQKPVRLQQLMDAIQGREAQDAGCIGF